MKKNFTLIVLPYGAAAWPGPGRVVVPLHTQTGNSVDAVAYSPFTNNIPDIAAVP